MWSSDLNGANKMKASNTWAAAVFSYFFGVVRWTRRELQLVDRNTCRIMKQYGAHHTNASILRLCLPRSDGGRGMQSLEALWEREAVSSARYLLGSEDQQVKDVMELQETLRARRKYSYIQVAQDILTKYDILVSLSYPLPNDTPPGRNLAGAIKNQQIESAKVGLLSKRVHGVYYGQTLQDDCYQKVMFEWLKDGRLRTETEGLIMAAQDGVIHTATYRNRILKMPIDTTCRACGVWPTETLGHILAKCRIYEYGLIKERHDRVLYQLVRGIATCLKLKQAKSLRAPGGIVMERVMGTRQKWLIAMPPY